MASIPTVAIVSRKDVTQRWLINAMDYDPARDTLWREPETISAPPDATNTENASVGNRAKPVMIAGQEYPSITAAVEATGYSRYMVSRMAEHSESS